MNGVGFVAACMAACLAAGMGLAVGLERTMTPPSLSDSSDAGNLALGSEEFDDVRSLNVDVTASPAGGVAFPVSGRVTFASCPADGVVRSGSREYGVDGTPLVSLHVFCQVVIGQCGVSFPSEKAVGFSPVRNWPVIARVLLFHCIRA